MGIHAHSGSGNAGGQGNTVLTGIQRIDISMSFEGLQWLNRGAKMIVAGGGQAARFSNCSAKDGFGSKAYPACRLRIMWTISIPARMVALWSRVSDRGRRTAQSENDVLARVHPILDAIAPELGPDGANGYAEYFGSARSVEMVLAQRRQDEAALDGIERLTNQRGDETVASDGERPGPIARQVADDMIKKYIITRRFQRDRIGTTRIEREDVDPSLLVDPHVGVITDQQAKPWFFRHRADRLLFGSGGI